MRGCLILSVLAGLVLAGAGWAEPSVAPVTHRQFQAVNANGEQTYTATQKVVLEGILLHQPGDMLNPTPDDSVTAMYDLSAQWQFFFQGVGDDHAGTAVYIAQLYDNLPWVMTGGYSNAEFIAELTRLNAARFSPGDRIRVTGWFLSYKGKMNLNEQHNKNPDHDFTIELVEPDVGLPKPQVVSLADLKDDQDRFIFDSERLVGGEYYQGCLIKIQDVNVVDPSLWAPDATLTVTDGTRTLPVKLGIGNGIYRGSFNLTQPCSVIGILDQDSAGLRDGYRLWVVNYDGNGSVLASYEHRMADHGDIVDPNGI